MRGETDCGEAAALSAVWDKAFCSTLNQYDSPVIQYAWLHCIVQVAGLCYDLLERGS